ncbi:15445_t:CDS:2, partial [Racocetra fulgida]
DTYNLSTDDLNDLLEGLTRLILSVTLAPKPENQTMSTRVPNEELSILEALINIRNRLQALKKDQQNSVKVQAVTKIYDEVTEQVTRLNDIRERATEPPVNDNRVNDVLDDVFQLLSLFFITIGKSRESPAAHVQLATIKVETVLNQLFESVSNMGEELVPIHQSLVDIKRNLGAIGAKGKFEISDIIPCQNKLRDIDSKRVDGKFLSSDGSIPS